MTWLLVLSILQDFEDPAKEIQWARSWEKAYEEARLRNVPIWIFVASDT
jgi:hypothetical protein